MNRCSINYDLQEMTECSTVASVLNVVVSITRSDAAHLYWMDPAARAVAPEDSRIPRDAAVLSSGDPPPETVGFPLRAEGKLAGVLTLSRKDSRGYTDVEIEAIGKLGATLVAAMNDLDRRREVELLRERLRSARQANVLLEKRLAERKLVERAKGLLQEKYGWTEEEAYYYIRRTSRQQRTPMGSIAQRIIEVVVTDEGERLSA
jgi:GAF domain-containing protein